MKKIIDFLMMSLFFSMIFFMSYIPYDLLWNFPSLKWYMYLLIGLNISILFRLIGKILNKK